ncbi:nucleolar and spindle-associated protein 1 [Reticulomyxa filosa]|uniref:Nucleolar and spindle-associated protein 1 n=1 Tax=Reticulomyxa filosa TaxID=46433 RepID=X6NJN4_RETFI|nr:nucleolar and spindle-associated protein 1 [Reticulomyxa filosa]|eukprot:ETO25567.1 nucleolar and spindle-associated protein 1 [Reticulomyxa filosa]
MFTAEKLRSLKRKDLQNLAKQHGLKANDKSESIIRKLSAVFDHENDEEEEKKRKEDNDGGESQTSAGTNNDKANADTAAAASNANNLEPSLAALPEERAVEDSSPFAKGSERALNENKIDDHEMVEKHSATTNESEPTQLPCETSDTNLCKEPFVSAANDISHSNGKSCTYLFFF